MKNEVRNRLINWLIFVFLVTLLIFRVFIREETSDWIQIISYLSVLITLLDLCIRIFEENHQYDSFKSVVGVFIIIATGLIIVLGFVFTGHLTFDTDVLTIFALLVSLPRDLYCGLVSDHLKKVEGDSINDEEEIFRKI